MPGAVLPLCPASRAFSTGVAMQLDEGIHFKSSMLPTRLRNGCLLHSGCLRYRRQQQHLLKCLSMLGTDSADSLVRLAVCCCELQVGRALALGSTRYAGWGILGQLLVAAWTQHKHHRDAPSTAWCSVLSHPGKAYVSCSPYCVPNDMAKRSYRLTAFAAI